MVSKNWVSAVLLAGTFFAAGPVSASNADATKVKVAQGALSGISEDGVLIWRGIPYATPPVGPLRWQAPRAAKPWRGVREASQFGARCMQPPGKGFKKPSTLPMSEDCLTLNVMRPAGASKRKLPVMVWIHGGGMVTGTGAEPTFNGPAIPKSGVVLVTINYRLGWLGFFAHPKLLETGQGSRPANFALLDQIEALRWVKANIAAFGGDQGNVTIFGESAGATSVDSLMTSRLARGLFHKAISSSANARMPSISIAEAEKRGAAAVEMLNLGATDAAMLRAIPAEKLMTLPPLDTSAGEAPIIDGVVLTKPILDVFAAGEEARVPFIVGSNDLELPPVYLPPEMAARVQPDPADRSALEAMYGSKAEFDLHIASDAVFSEPARQLALRHARIAPTWQYRFAVLAERAPKMFKGASHAADVPYIFQTLSTTPWPMAERDYRLASTITDYWTSFAKTGNPNGGGRPAWPAAGTPIMTFTNDGPHAGPDPRAARLDRITASYGTATPVFRFADSPPATTATVSQTQNAVSTASAGPLSLDTPIDRLLADAKARAILDADLPGLTAHPMLGQFRSMTLKELQLLAPGILSAEKLAKVADDLAKR